MTDLHPFLGRSSYLETVARLPLFNRSQGTRPGLHMYDTEIPTADGVTHAAKASMFWPSMPPGDGTCVTSWASLAFDKDSDMLIFSSSRDESEVAWGSLSEPSYIDRNVVRDWRVRAMFEVIASETDHILGRGFAYVNGQQLEFFIKVLINRSAPRWAPFVGPKVGDICGCRGKVEAVELSPRKMLIVQLEAYSAPSGPPNRGAQQGSPTSQEPRPGSAASRWKAARERVLKEEAARREDDKDAMGDVEVDSHSDEDVAAPAATKGRKRKITVKKPAQSKTRKVVVEEEPAAQPSTMTGVADEHAVGATEQPSP